MKSSKLFASFLFSIFLSCFVSLNLTAQTMVQWYTSEGDFNVQLREDLVPVTAQNFIDLTNSHFYDGLLFHRVIPGFMIQDGCPIGDGTGGPGYSFDDEFHPDLRHNEAGILSMANSGPNTNGSQYFITVAPTTWLNDLHAVFGKVIDGLDVVIAISEVETDANDRPIVDVVIDSIRVIPMGAKSLEITSPVTGDIFLTDHDQIITWESEFVADVNIELSLDGGSTWDLIADSISCNAKSFVWETPANLVTNCMIRITDATNSTLTDSESFSLGRLELVTPITGAFFGGEELLVEWESEGIQFVGIEYQHSEDGDWYLVEDNIPALNNSYNWMVPEIASNKYKVRVFVSGTPSAYDMSTGIIRICLLDLLSPIGGEEYIVDSITEVRWYSEYVPRLTLEFSADNGNSWTEIVAEIFASDSIYQWTVPQIASDSCFLKAYYKGKPQLYRMNETPFSISWPFDIDENISNENFGFSLIPNPVSDILTIDYVVKVEIKNILLTIYDLNGKVISTFADEDYFEGSNNVTYDVSSLPPGVYLLVVNADGSISSQKFVKE